MRLRGRMKFQFVYTGIRVRDLEQSIRFYTEVLGLRLVKRAEEPVNKGEYALVEDEETGQALELNWHSADSPVAKPYPEQEGEELDHLGFEVADLEATLAYLRERGFAPVLGPNVDGGFAVAYIRDPDGIWVECFQRLTSGQR